MTLVWTTDVDRVRVNGVDKSLTFEEMIVECARGCAVAIYVTGWSEPWRCEYEDGRVRAFCPTSSKVCPIVERITHAGELQ